MYGTSMPAARAASSTVALSAHTTSWSLIRIFTLGKRLSPSAVDFAEHDVETADRGDHVGNQAALHEPRQGLKIDEGRRADLKAERMIAAVSDDEKAQLPLGILDRRVDLAFRRANA